MLRSCECSTSVSPAFHLKERRLLPFWSSKSLFSASVSLSCCNIEGTMHGTHTSTRSERDHVANHSQPQPKALYMLVRILLVPNTTSFQSGPVVQKSRVCTPEARARWSLLCASARILPAASQGPSNCLQHRFLYASATSRMKHKYLCVPAK